MVYNHYIRCQVCGSVTRIRLQVGKLDMHPVVVTCGKCNTSLLGNVYIDQNNPNLKFEFKNADNIENYTMDNGDYLVECSGEFPVHKQREDDPREIFLISPFIKQMTLLGEDKNKIEEYFKVISGLRQTNSKWDIYKRILDLFQNDSPYFEQELYKEFREYSLPSKTAVERLYSVHRIELLCFSKYLKPDILINTRFNDDIMCLNPVQMKKLNDFLNSHEGYHLDQIQAQIFKSYDSFMDIFYALIPAISVMFVNEDSFDYENNGTTTSTFETVKQFYLDTYETLGNLMVIPVALNNIYYRGDIDSSDSINSRTVTLEEYIGLAKANRFHFCTNSEKYTDFLKLQNNASLRNAIGHNDITYDSKSQLITYIPNPRNRSHIENEYLMRFELEALHQFQSILAISEYLYRLREFKFMQDGDLRLIEGMKSKISAYDLCPCGSGAKYKFCHMNK